MISSLLLETYKFFVHPFEQFNSAWDAMGLYADYVKKQYDDVTITEGYWEYRENGRTREKDRFSTDNRRHFRRMFFEKFLVFS